MSIESYDGLCGLIHLNSSSDLRVRCKYEFGHSGPHSWDKKNVGMTIVGGTVYSCSDSYQEFWKHAGYIPRPNGYKKIVPW